MTIDFSAAFRSLQGMINGAINQLPQIVLSVIVFIIFFFVARSIRKLVHRVSAKQRRHRNLSLVLGRVAQGGVLALGLLVALVIAIPTFKPGQLVEILGIGGVAIGFAFRDILQNFLAGILLLITEPFRIGDQIKVDDFEGTVEDIQTRATTIRTYDGRRVVIPNSDLFTKAVIVNTAYDKRRVHFDFGIGYSDDIDKAREIILNQIHRLNVAVEEPAPDVIVVGLEASSVTLRARWWIAPPKRAEANDTRDKVISEVKKALAAEGIDLPFPTHHILFHDQTEETDGDRTKQREGWPARDGENPKPRSLAGALREAATRFGQNGHQPEDRRAKENDRI